MNPAGYRFDFTKLAAHPEPPRQSRRHPRVPDGPEVLAARARYYETRQALEATRSAYQAAKAEHARSKSTLAALHARAGTVLGGNADEPIRR